jgi:copper chaperone CopZ
MFTNQIKYPSLKGLKNLPISIRNFSSETLSGCCGRCQTIKITRSKKEMKETTNNHTTMVTAPEIVCGGCAGSIKKALGNLEGVCEVEVDVPTKQVKVEHNESVSREEIVDALDRAGYSAV